nr:hypothetical protein [Methylobacterium sp. L1A1]
MPVVLILLAVSAPERPFPTMQACAEAAPAIARRAGRGVMPVCVTVSPTVRRGR